MIEWFTAPGSAPFTVALLVMVGLTAVELVALLTGFSVNDVVDDLVTPHGGVTVGDAATGMEATSSLDGQGPVARFLAWLYVGRVPVLMILIVLLAVFGLSGLILQGVLRDLTGLVLPTALAVPLVLVASLPLVRACTGGLARILPRDESSAVSTESFVGLTALVVGPGRSVSGSPGQARVVDGFGTQHYVLVEPDEAEGGFDPGTTVLLVRRIDGSRFSAIANPNPTLVDA